MTGKPVNLKKTVTAIFIIHVLFFTVILSAQPENNTETENMASSRREADYTSYDTLMLSGRIEMIEYASWLKPIRESGEKNRFYFNNIYINLEGYLHNRINYIIEFQALTSDLYLFGGFITVAESLEGMGTGAPGSRERQISDLVLKQIADIDEASRKPNFERAMVDFNIHEMIGIKIGKVRNPFGFWDDYSLFRNLSFIRTDPISLGIPLRRTDMGALLYGSILGKYFTYELGVMDGEYVFTNNDKNKKKDIVIHMGTGFYRIDLGFNGYVHDLQKDWREGSSFAGGVDLRFRMTDRLTFLGEYIYMRNELYNLTTRGGYGQLNYDLSDLVTEGLRLNMFFEAYNSYLLKIDLEPGLQYRFKGTYFQGSAGLIYTLSRNIDFGLQFIIGIDEEGGPGTKGAFKVDAKF